MRPTAPARLIALLVLGTASACQREGAIVDPGPVDVEPVLGVAPGERRVVVVNPGTSRPGTATTIQQGIDMVASGGRVLVMPGSYPERLLINKGVTLEAIAERRGAVIVAPPDRPPIAVEVATAERVTIRDLTVHYNGLNGIVGNGSVAAVNLLLDGVTVLAVEPPPGAGNLIAVTNDARSTGRRARLVVRRATLDGRRTPPSVVQNFGIQVYGDVDALLTLNTIKNTGGACIWIRIRDDLAGETNAEIAKNDVDACPAAGRAGAIIVGSAANIAVTPTRPATAVGVVNIVGNTIRNSIASCNMSTGINYEYLGGRIERNTLVNVVPECALPSVRNLPGAIWIGSLPARGFPAVTAVVRFNDIAGNAHAGLRVGSNQTTAIDATCNWWGSASGPSGAGQGSGDAVLAEPGAATPRFAPFATRPIAGTQQRARGALRGGCLRGDLDDEEEENEG